MTQFENRRAWASPVYASMLKKRHKFGIDGRILLCPIILPTILAIPFAHGFWNQLSFAGVAVLIWMIAKALWQFNPYFIDDLMAEFKSPSFFSGGE
jgi:hypothetical protein